MNELYWLAVPGGIVTRGSVHELLLRVLVSPRLDGPTLRQSGMGQWPPQSLLSAPLAVEFQANATSQTHVRTVDPPHVEPQSGVWGAFFDPSMIVAPRQAASSAPVDVTRTAADAGKIDETFRAVAATPLFKDIDKRPELEANVRRELLTRWSTVAPQPSASGASAPSRVPDFHRTVALFREHPAVLRALGLIFELRLPLSDLPAGLSKGLVRVRWPGAPGTLPAIVSPRTKYDDRFLPASTSRIDAGMVALTGTSAATRWEVVTVDVDTGVRRLTEAARAVAATHEVTGGTAAPIDGSKLTMLPSLRTGGLSLVRHGRQADFDQRREMATARAPVSAASEAILDADDLVLGYRMDVRPQGGDWLSLHERDAEYTVKGSAGVVQIGGATFREEGHVKSHAAIDDGSGKLRADETVARWNGWSLAVPRPEYAASSNGLRPRQSTLPFDFDWTFSVPAGTLPKLRFARTYSIRARVADLAGGGLVLSDPAAERHVISGILYRRYEPVSPPITELPGGEPVSALGPGEAVEHVVMRTGADTAGVPSHLRRVLSAPRMGLLLAEQHGALDQMTRDELRAFMQRLLEAYRGDGTTDVLVPDYAAGGVTVFPMHAPGAPQASPIERGWANAWPELTPMEVELRERTGSSESVLAWEAVPSAGGAPGGHRLIVRLAKAEELALELSSFLKDDFLDHFAIKGATFPGTSEEVASQGRHPMVSPVRTVTFTYAVRRPLSDPRGTIRPIRGPGETHAVLRTDPASLSIHPNSTGKVEITATWKDRLHDTPTTVTNVPVKEVAVNRGDEVFKEPIRHELGDTRHRRIDYTVSAVSRFRQFFTGGSEESFVARTVFSNVSVPSSARPSSPTVASILPAVSWEEERGTSAQFTLVRRRLGHYVRIELARPWFETGDGERLAVVVAKDRYPPPKIQTFLTTLGVDPVKNTFTAPPYPTPSVFLGGGDPQDVMLPEAGTAVTVIPFEPWFDAGRCFADIRLSLGSIASTYSYWPFVQLAVARYQPESVVNLALSPVVKTEMIQLLPDRTLKVSRSGPTLSVSLEGFETRETGDKRNRFQVILEQLKAPNPAAADFVDIAALGDTTDGIPAWVPVMGQTRVGTLGAQVVQLQAQSGLGPIRLRIREFEAVADHDGALSNVDDDLTGRTVYSDVVRLPS